MKNWQHKVQYYETDQMGIVHHSNSIRWFEEARTWMMDEMQFGYEKMEALNILVPVLEASAKYISMVKFGETVEITTGISQFTGVKMVIEYEIRDVETGELRTTGQTKHAFLDKESYRPISLKRNHKEIYDLFNEVMKK
ncbi:acyl-CoA thioester hydrolase [Marinilactibacillus piezotolerans]|uniref:Acyl-CoA thioester hydrolase n=1 Tax=Marinilactibacillus piezotolerans TaxID=258723 RepID=A0A1I3YUN5_9LACT|nr:thioesterase family protein [Marinilactibacillus piezotolerans]SFK35069.1 acyl-CoA thioester hydrolase [Marinilactibacillus piezotolerans]